MRKISKLTGAIPLTRSELKQIRGGLTDLLKYDENDQCQNYTEITPVGCPCTSESICPRRVGPGALSTSGPTTIEGACIDGVCAGSTLY